MKGKISVWTCFLLLALLPGVAFNATAQARRLNVVCSVQIEWCEKIRSAYRKICVERRSQAVKWVHEHGLRLDTLALPGPAA